MAYIYEAIRTPRGRGKPSGALHGVKPISLVVGLIDELRRRAPGVDYETVSDLILGIVGPIGDQGGCLPKTAALAAGLPERVCGVQVNRFCASGLEAVNMAAAKVDAGHADLVLAGGVESMSRVPMGADGGAWYTDPETNYATGFVPQGVSADLIATIEGFSRTDVDSFAAESQARAAKAWADGRFERSVVPVVDRVGQVILDRDEHLRPSTTVEGLGGLPASFEMIGEAGGFDAVALDKYHWVERIEHVHTAGNSSGIVDGAALVLVGSAAAGEAAGLRPRGRIVSVGYTGVDPTIMLTGPAAAVSVALSRAGLAPDDIDLYEVNEAFAAVPLHFSRHLGVPLDKINVNGGAIALGHPLGATGAMLLGTALDELDRRGGRYGVVTLCAGGGMGVATLVEVVK